MTSAAQLCMYPETVCYIFKSHYSEESVTRFTKKGRAQLKGNVSFQMKMTWMWMQPFLYLTSGKLLKENYTRHHFCGFSFSLPLFQNHYFFYTSMVRCYSWCQIWPHSTSFHQSKDNKNLPPVSCVIVWLSCKVKRWPDLRDVLRMWWKKKKKKTF